MVESRASSQDKPNKTADICFQCRNRKVRCDRTVGGCENCVRLGFPCSLSAQTNESASSSYALDRRRSQRACVPCREKKAKCSNELPSCHRCLRRKIQCHYTIRSSQSQSTSPAQQSSTAQDSLGTSPFNPRPDIQTSDAFLRVSKVIIRQHLDAFFEFIAPIPCFGFVHRASFLHKWNQGHCNPRLLKTICGVGARFIASSTSLDAATGWLQEAENDILQNLATLAVSDVEALILIALDHCMSRRFVKMLTSTCLAARMAYLMRLNRENPKLTFLAQESRRRLMWSIYVFDSIYSSGRSELTSCSEGTIHIQLPCHERAFELDEPSLGAPSRDLYDTTGAGIGTTGFLIRVLYIRDRIQRFVQKIVQRQRSLETSIEEFEAFESELAAFQQALPTTHKFTQKNLLVRAFTSKLTPYIMLHLWWHQCYCHLYRLLVPGLREALPLRESNKSSPELTARCQEQCFTHASAAVSVVASVAELGKDCWISDPALGMCIFHLARLLARFSRPPFSKLTPEQLIERVQICYDSLERPAEIYPTTQLLRNSIQELLSGDAQNGTRGSSIDGTSSGEGQIPPANGSAAQPRPITVYSRFSIMDEVQRLEFPSDEDVHLPATAGRGREAQRSPVEGQSQPLLYGVEPEPISGGGGQSHVDATLLPEAMYDVSMLGFDFGYGVHALDPFIDYSLQFECNEGAVQSFHD